MCSRTVCTLMAFLSALLLSGVVLSEETTLTYDDNNQLIKVENGLGKANYLYDSTGNILSVNIADDSSTSLLPIQTTYPTDETNLADSQIQFEWQSEDPQVITYDFFLSTNENDLVRFKTGITEPLLSVSFTDIQSELSKQMYWQVVGYDKSGRSITSNLASFYLLDSDQDSLFDFQEVSCLIGTDEDTDGDGISDSQELTLGLNPCLRDTDGMACRTILNLVLGVTQTSLMLLKPIINQRLMLGILMPNKKRIS